MYNKYNKDKVILRHILLEPLILVSGNKHNEKENQKESIQNVFKELNTENELSCGIQTLNDIISEHTE